MTMYEAGKVKVPPGFEYVRGPYAETAAHRLGIQHCPVSVWGYKSGRSGRIPVVVGVLIAEEDAPQLLKAIKARESPAKKRPASHVGLPGHIYYLRKFTLWEAHFPAGLDGAARQEVRVKLATGQVGLVSSQTGDVLWECWGKPFKLPTVKWMRASNDTVNIWHEVVGKQLAQRMKRWKKYFRDRLAKLRATLVPLDAEEI